MPTRSGAGLSAARRLVPSPTTLATTTVANIVLIIAVLPPSAASDKAAITRQSPRHHLSVAGRGSRLSLVAQRLNRIEPGGFAGWIESEEYADRAREDDGAHHSGRRQQRRPRRQPRDHRRRAD